MSLDPQFMNQWRLADKITKNLKVRILADRSKNIFFPHDPYQIWEIESKSEIIIPYAAIRQARSSYAKNDNLSVAAIMLTLLFCYIVTRAIAANKKGKIT